MRSRAGSIASILHQVPGGAHAAAASSRSGSGRLFRATAPGNSRSNLNRVRCPSRERPPSHAPYAAYTRVRPAKHSQDAFGDGLAGALESRSHAIHSLGVRDLWSCYLACPRERMWEVAARHRNLDWTAGWGQPAPARRDLGPPGALKLVSPRGEVRRNRATERSCQRGELGDHGPTLINFSSPSIGAFWMN